MSRQTSRLNDPKRVSSELFTLTYGSLVAQLLKDYENVEETNKQLEKMGHNIGVRLIEDYLAKSNSGRCYDLKDTAEKIQSAFKMFLGIVPTIGNWSSSGDEFSIVMDANPLVDFVELPTQYNGLKYSNILCGVIKGALEMVQLDVDCSFVQDHLKGDNVTELKVKFIQKLQDATPAGEN